MVICRKYFIRGKNERSVRMKEEKKGLFKSVIKGTAFILIFVLLFFYIQDIFELKGSCYGKYTCYENQEEESINVFYFGNSRCNRAINPMVIDEIAGTVSFNYGIQGLRAKHVYFRYLDALRNQAPKLVVLETSTFLPSKEANEESYQQRTVLPLPTSLFKFETAWELGSDFKERMQLFLPFLRFHARYRDIAAVDYIYIRDINPDFAYENQSSEETMMESRGYMPYPKDKKLKDDGNNYFGQSYSGITEIGVPDPECDEYFRKTVELAKQNGSQVLLLSIPSLEENATAVNTVPITNYLKELYKDDPDVKILDLNLVLSDVGLNYDNYHNAGHVNRSGAQLISEYVGNYVKENYDISSWQ